MLPSTEAHGICIIGRYSDADWEQQSGRRPGSLQAQLRLSTQAVRQFNALSNCLRSLATISVFVVVALLVDPIAALAIGVLGVLLGAVVLPMRTTTRRLSSKVVADEYEYGEALSQAEQHAAELRVFQAWPAVTGELSAVSTRIENRRRRLISIASALPLVYQYGGVLIIVALIALTQATADVAAERLGGVASVGLLLLRSVQYGQLLQVSLQMLAETVPALDLLEDELAAPPKRRGVGISTLGNLVELRLEDVSYRYPSAEHDSLINVSLTLRAGSVVGVRGDSGSGKSTLAQVLLQLRDPTRGRLLANGVDATSVYPELWFGHFGYVPQRPQLLRGTLRDNVTFFSDHHDEESIWAAIAAAGLDEFTRSLPAGLDTPVGPGYRDLSGGQVQRIGVARALLRQPDVVLLDEPTSALDPRSEAVVHEALEALRSRRDLLVLVIAHRESTLAVCDRIITLHAGRVISDDETSRRFHFSKPSLDVRS